MEARNMSWRQVKPPLYGRKEMSININHDHAHTSLVFEALVCIKLGQVYPSTNKCIYE